MSLGTRASGRGAGALGLVSYDAGPRLGSLPIVTFGLGVVVLPRNIFITRNGKWIEHFYRWILDEISILQWVRTQVLLSRDSASQRTSGW